MRWTLCRHRDRACDTKMTIMSVLIIVTIIFLEFSQINAERDKERHHLDELNRRLNCQIENLESQKEKMNSDLHTLTIENEKHKEDLKKLKTQIKNLKNEITMKSDKETQTDLSANQIEGKALAKKDQFITWLKNDNDFLNDEKNKLSDLVVELETHLGKLSIINPKSGIHGPSKS